MTSGSLFAQVAAPLRPYVTCRFDDGLAVLEKEPTPPAASGRTAMTLVGPKQVAITRGERLLFAYPDKSPFARATVEQLPAKSFAQGKADLVSAFDKLIASDDNVRRNYTLKPHINGYEAHGLDRKELGGTVLGIYMLVDDASRTVISIDFLNQPADERSFSSMDQYATMRDSFLTGYTSCIRANLHGVSAPTAAKSPATTTAPAKKSVRKG